jgi:hypothetical protein
MQPKKTKKQQQQQKKNNWQKNSDYKKQKKYNQIILINLQRNWFFNFHMEVTKFRSLQDSMDASLFIQGKL